MSTHVPGADAPVRRAAQERAAASSWRRLCDPETTGVSLTDLAEHYLGLRRAKLYASFEAIEGHARLAWLELLPAPAQLAYLRKRAHELGHELRTVDSGAASLADIAGAVGATLAAVSESEADGLITPSEAARDIEALEKLQAAVSRAITLRRRALDERGGLRVARVG